MRHERDVAGLISRLEGVAAATNPNGQRIGVLSFGCVVDQDVPFPFHAAMAILSAQARHPSARTLLFAEAPPHGPSWDLVSSRLDLFVVPRFQRYGRATIVTAQHRMDIVRLLVLMELGGLFSATDMLVLRPMDELTRYPLVLGVQGGAPPGQFAFGDGMAVATRGNMFCRHWLDAYAEGDVSAGPTIRSFYAMRLPVRLYAEHPDTAHILPHDAWFAPGRRHIRRFMFASDQVEGNAALVRDHLAVRLWRDMIAEILAQWDSARIFSEDCLFARLCRDALSCLPEGDGEAILDLARSQGSITPLRPDVA